MASDYSYVYSSPCKSRSAEFYEGEESSMGVLVTGPWPMSHQGRHPLEPRTPEKYPPVSLRVSPSSGSKGLSGRKAVRPLSMPPQASNLVLPPNAGCCESEPQPQLGSRLPPSIPSRISLTLDRVPVSPPTCVPWLRKMKVIKKLQRRMGMGQFSSTSPLVLYK
jgi:hypothetical protein